MFLLKLVKRSLLVSIPLVSFTCKEAELASRAYPSIDTKAITEVTDTGATFNAEVLSIGNLGVKDHGFVYGDTFGPSFENSDRISLGEVTNVGSISTVANRNLVKDRKYFVKAYAVGKNTNIVVYGQQQEFISRGSIAPEITDFIPHQGSIGDTILLTGKGFSNVKSNNRISFGTQTALTIKASQDSMWWVVPTSMQPGESLLSLYLGQFIVDAKSKFILKPIILNHFSPSVASFGDTVTLEGSGFPRSKSLVKVTLLQEEAEVLNAMENKIQVRVSEKVKTSKSFISLVAGLQSKSFGDTVKLKAPVINDFTPIKGAKDTQVIISGLSFSPIASNNRVKINEKDALIVDAKVNRLIVKVPELTPGDYSFSITVANQKVTSVKKFAIIGPVVSNVSPLTGTWGDLVTISGRGFSSIKSENLVKLNETSCEVVNASESAVQIKIPLGLLTKESILTVKVPIYSPFESSFVQKFSLNPPIISGFSPAQGKSGSIITIEGDNFHPVGSNQTVDFGSFHAVVMESSRTLLKVQLPTSLVDSEVKVKVSHSEQSALSNSNFKIISPWRKIQNFRAGPVQNAFGFSTSGTGFVSASLAGGNKLWTYDPAADNWSNALAGIDIYGNNFTVFTIGDDVWAGLPDDGNGHPYTSQMKKYDPITNTWSASAVVPGIPLTHAIGFSLNGYGYVTNGTVKLSFPDPQNVLHDSYFNVVKTYKYDPQTDEWIEVAFSPGVTDPVPNTFLIGRTGASVFAIGDNAYIFGGNSLSDLLIYQASADTWQRAARIPVPSRSSASSFTIGSIGYIIGGNSNSIRLNDIWAYNSTTQTWSMLENFPGEARAGAIVFVIGDKAYYGLGAGNTSGLLDDFWEFDPSKL